MNNRIVRHRIRVILITATTLVFISIASQVNAHGDNDEQGGFRGSVAGGVMWIDSANSLNPEHSDKRINSLESSPEKKSEIVPILLPELSYSFGSNYNQGVYLNTTPPIDEAGRFSILGGYSYKLKGIGVVDVNGFLNPFETAWEDPYLVGVDRKETDVMKYGVKLAFNRILDTGLWVNLVYMNDDVDNDALGLRIPELNRDGYIVAFNTNYSFYISDNLEIRPRLSYRKGEYDGESNSFSKFKADLEVRYTLRKWDFVPRVYASFSDYDSMNPVFHKTQDDEGYGASLLVGYREPFGFENYRVLGRIEAGKSDSNINFFDTESFSLGFAVQYTF